jgi:hypothetical protein
MDNVWQVLIVFDASDYSFSYQGSITPEGLIFALPDAVSSYLVTLSTINSSQVADFTGIDVQGDGLTVEDKWYLFQGKRRLCFLLGYDRTQPPPPEPPAFTLNVIFMGLPLVVPDPTIINIEPPSTAAAPAQSHRQAIELTGAGPGKAKP